MRCNLSIAWRFNQVIISTSFLINSMFHDGNGDFYSVFTYTVKA